MILKYFQFTKEYIMEKILNQIEQLETQLKNLNKIVETDALKVKNEVDSIISKIEKENILKWDLLKLELIKTKINALSNLGNLKETISELEKAENFILKEVVISYDSSIEDKEKKEILKELYIEVLNSISKNSYQVLKQDWSIDENKKNKYLEYIDLIISKLNNLDIKWIWEYYKWLFYSTIWDNNNFIKYNKQSALTWEKKEAITIYVDQQLNYFLERYNKLKSNEDKEKFLKENLENLEEDIFQFVDDFHYDENWKRIKLKQWWHKELYWIIWDFYKNIWLYSESLSSYKSWTQSYFKWNYKLHKKIAELYKKTNIAPETEKYKKEKIKKAYENLYNLAYINNDPENVFYWLEKTAELSKTKEEKYEKYWQIIYMFELNYENYSSNDKLILSYINACKKINSKILNENTLYINLTYIDTKYILLYANYLEEKWELTLAFINYITNYNLYKNNNSLSAIIIFMQDKIINKISKEITQINQEIIQIKEELKSIENNKINKAFINLKKDEIKVLKSNIKILIKEKQDLERRLLNLEKLTDDDIKDFFRLTLTNQYLENINFENTRNYFDYYNYDLPKSDIYLEAILEQIQILFWYKKEILKPFFNKIKKQEAFTQDDLNDFKDIIETKNFYTILKNIDEEELKKENEKLQKEIDHILKEIKKKEKKKK